MVAEDSHSRNARLLGYRGNFCTACHPVPLCLYIFHVNNRTGGNIFFTRKNRTKVVMIMALWL